MPGRAVTLRAAQFAHRRAHCFRGDPGGKQAACTHPRGEGPARTRDQAAEAAPRPHVPHGISTAGAGHDDQERAAGPGQRRKGDQVSRRAAGAGGRSPPRECRALQRAAWIERRSREAGGPACGGRQPIQGQEWRPATLSGSGPGCVRSWHGYNLLLCPGSVLPGISGPGLGADLLPRSAWPALIRISCPLAGDRGPMIRICGPMSRGYRSRSKSGKDMIDKIQGI